ncbi:MAG: NAD-binding protein [Ignavibacteriota bacterium]
MRSPSSGFIWGASGSGVAMKLVVNTLLGIGMQALAEAVTLGAALGLPRNLLFDTLAKTAVVSPVQAGKLATTKRHDYTPSISHPPDAKRFRIGSQRRNPCRSFPTDNGSGRRDQRRGKRAGRRRGFLRSSAADGTADCGRELAAAGGVGARQWYRIDLSPSPTLRDTGNLAQFRARPTPLALLGSIGPIAHRWHGRNPLF